MDSYNRGEDSRKAIEKELTERAYSLSRTSACCGTASGKGIEEGCKYKLYIKDDSYCIERDIDSSVIENAETDILQRWVNEEKIVLRRESFSCTLLDSELTCSSKPNIAGEVIIKVNDIGIRFASPAGEEYLFYAKNTPENTKPQYSFFKEIGVKKYYNIIDVPEDVFPIRVDGGNGFLTDGCMYIVFRQQGRLFFLRPDMNDSGYVVIAEIGIEEIRFYRQEGSLHYEQSISGSGGAKNSYGGAIVGGLLFGTAGAVIGSRKNETPVSISSTTVKHDTRIVALSVKRGIRSYNISFPVETEGTFDWLIPEKQYEYVISERRQAFKQENDILFKKDENGVIEPQKRLFSVPKPELPVTSESTADSPTEKPNDMTPIIVDKDRIKCPVCGAVQNSNRIKCHRCGTYFHG